MEENIKKAFVEIVKLLDRIETVVHHNSLNLDLIHKEIQDLTRLEPKDKDDFEKPTISLFHISNLWNEYFPERPAPFDIGRNKHFKNFLHLSGYLTLEKWEEMLKRAKKSDFLSTNSWFGFLWCLDYDNFLKVYDGHYDNDGAKIDARLSTILEGEK